MAKTDAEIREFYYFIGKAAWHIQYLEDALCSIIAVAQYAKKPVTPEMAYKELAKTRKMTLGKIVGDAASHQIVPKELDDRLNHFVCERNWLIHRSAHENSNDLADDTCRRNLINRVKAIYKESEFLTQVLSELLFALCRSRGVNEEAINIRTTEEAKKLWGDQHF